MMKYVICSAVLFASACTGGLSGPADTPPAGADNLSACPVHSASDVEMWINAMPGPNDNPTLITTFKVTAPTPGYTFALETLQIKESYPPQYVFGLVATPPDGMVTQVETVTDVRLEIANLDYDKIALATVSCGNSTLFDVDSVPTAY